MLDSVFDDVVFYSYNEMIFHCMKDNIQSQALWTSGIFSYLCSDIDSVKGKHEVRRAGSI